MKSAYRFRFMPGVALALLSIAFVLSAFGQGALNPAEPPAPTMKTLAQTEPRTPIESLPFNITQSGSYYLTKNLHFTAVTGDAITIAASNVTVDLMGFTLSSSNDVTGDAIHINDARSNIAVTNGVINGGTTVLVSGSFPNLTWNVTRRGFKIGIHRPPDGIGPREQSRLTQLNISGCREDAIRVVAAIVRDVAAGQNGEDGISAPGGIVTGCTASNNGQKGIAAAATVADSQAHLNGSNGIDADTVSNSTVTSSGASGIVANTVSNCTAGSNVGNGITAVFNATVTNSRASSNGSDGIRAPSGVVAFCRASSNNRKEDGSVDIDAAGATRTGNNPTP